MGTKEYLSPNANPSSFATGSTSWSAAGQLTSAATKGLPGTKEMVPSLFAPRPLANPLAPLLAYPEGETAREPSVNIDPPTMPGGNGYPGYGEDADAATVTPEANPTYPAGYGQVTSPAWGQQAPASTSAYGQPMMPSTPPAGSASPSVSGGLSGGSYSSGAAASPAFARTTVYGMPAPNWQPALPVSPWSTYDRGSGGGLGGSGLGTETILSTDLKALRRSRLKGWTYFVLLLGVTGTLGYQGGKRFFAMKGERDRLKTTLADMEREHNDALVKLGVSQAEVRAKSASGIEPAGASATSAPTTKLADDLKKQLTGVAGLNVETRGDKVVVTLEQGALFQGNDTEVGLSGYRVLYKFGKALKGVKDRRIVVTVPTDGKKGAKGARAWSVAAARAVSLGRFVIDDLSVEAHRVSAAAPAVAAGRVRNVEFALEAMPVHSKS